MAASAGKRTSRSRSRGWGGAAGVLLLVLALPAARAQVTETAATVEPGRWLVEGDLAAWGRDRTPDARATYRSYAYVQFTRGVGANWDLQVALEPYLRGRVDWRDPGLLDEDWRSSSRVYLRSKYRFAQAPDGRWALAILPYLAVPLDEEDGHRFVDVGVALPLSVALSEQWYVDAQVQADGFKTPDHRREWWYRASGNVQRVWSDRWGSYAELVADFGTGRWSGSACSAGLGVTRTWRGGWGADVALYHGLTDNAFDWEWVVRFVYSP